MAEPGGLILIYDYLKQVLTGKAEQLKFVGLVGPGNFFPDRNKWTDSTYDAFTVYAEYSVRNLTK